MSAASAGGLQHLNSADLGLPSFDDYTLGEALCCLVECLTRPWLVLCCRCFSCFDARPCPQTDSPSCACAHHCVLCFPAAPRVPAQIELQATCLCSALRACSALRLASLHRSICRHPDCAHRYVLCLQALPCVWPLCSSAASHIKTSQEGPCDRPMAKDAHGPHQTGVQDAGGPCWQSRA